MAGFYDKNGNRILTTAEKKKKKNNAPLAHLHIDNSETKNTLEYDGINFGTVTDRGLKAIQNNNLDSYTPSTDEEKKAIESYKKYLDEKKPEKKRADDAFAKIEQHKPSDYSKELTMPFDPFKKSKDNTAKQEESKTGTSLLLDNPFGKTTIKTSEGNVEVDTTPKRATKEVFENSANELIKKEAETLNKFYSMSSEEIEPHLKDKNTVAYHSIYGDLTWQDLYTEVKSYEIIDNAKKSSNFVDKNKYQKKDVKYEKMYVNYSGLPDGGYYQNYIPEKYKYAHIYNLVNGDKDAIAVEEGLDVPTFGLDVDDSQRNIHLTDEEKSAFNYLYNTGKIDEAIKFLEVISSELSKRRVAYQNEMYKKQAEEDPIGTSVVSVPLNVFNNFMAIPAMAADYLEDGEINENDSIYAHRRRVETTRSTVENNIDSDVGKFFYRHGMNLADNVATQAVTGFGSLGKASKYASGFIMSSGSFVDTTLEAKRRGLSDEQALALGGVAGGAEMFFESKSFEALFSSESLAKGGWKYFLDNIKTEVIGELGTELTNDVADVLISRDLNEFKTEYDGYIKEGYSEKDAWLKTFNTTLLRYGDIAAGTVFTAGAMATPGTVTTSISQKKTGEHILSKNMVDGLFELAKTTPEESSGHTLYSDYVKKGITSDNITASQIGVLYDTLKADFYNTLESKSKKVTSEQKVEAYTNLLILDNFVSNDTNTEASESVDTTKTQTPSPVKTGDTFKSNDTGDMVKVIDRGETYTRLEVTKNDGNVTIKEVKNDVADGMSISPAYSKIDTVKTPTVVNPSTLNKGKAETTSVKTSDNVSASTPIITETQPTTIKTETTPTTNGVTSAYTNNNQKIDLKYKVVSADDLIVSNNADGTVNPNYPQELQPRERTRQASILQVQNIAKNIVPEKLGESANVSDGSPIIGNDNVVESGNGRTMALSLMYKNNPEGAQKYIEFIKANAEKFGIDANNLPKNPVLVRERLTNVDRVEFVKQANESNLSAMSATELAKSDSERLTSDILNLLVANDDGNINTAENKAFVGRVISNVFSQNDLNSVVGANGMLSANGLERIRNALFYKAYNDVYLASKLSESLDNDIKNITNVLVNIAPKIVQIKNGIANGDLYDLDFSKDIVDGINYLQEAKRQDLKIKDFANQLTIGEDASNIVKAIAYLFEQKNRGAKQATLFFNHLCDTILSKDANQLGFLNEDTKAPTKEEVLNEAINRYSNDEQGTGINFSEMFVSQRSEESGQTVDTRGIGDNIESVAEQRPADSESDGTSEQHRPVEEETALTGDVGTQRPSEIGTADSRPENHRNETEVGAGRNGELSTAEVEYKHPYDEKTVSKEYLDSVNPEIENAIINIRNGNLDSVPDVIEVVQLGERITKAISELVGYDISGYTCKIEKDALAHIEKRHGINGNHDHSLSDPKDVARMGYAINNHDNIDWVRKNGKIKTSKKYKDKNNNPAQIILIQSKIDGTYCVSDVAPDNSKKTVWITSARIQKKHQGLDDTLDVSPKTTSENALDASDNNIPQDTDIVNSGVSNNSETDTQKLTDKCELHSTKHTSTGDDLWVVTLKDKLSAEDYKELSAKVKSVGGYYSRFAKTPDGKAIPGFVFKAEPTANELKVFNDFFGDTETPTQNVQNTPKSSENVSGEETPAQTQKVNTEQNTGEIEVKATDSATTKSKGTIQIADYVAEKLSKGEKLSAMELQTISAKAFGGTMANNVYTVKDAYDAMELGVNKYILSMKDVSAQKMLELLELLPTQTKRTEEQVKFQQFSTPPSIAYLANYVANVNAKDIMLEPSAGIGGIAVFAKREGATVYVNELDNRRLEVLKNMPFDKFFNENAEQIDNILGGKIEPTVIVMNPPFSSSSERNIHNTKIGAKHIEEALKILAPNGRLVAIVGHGMADDKPAFRDWWKDIKSKYNVRANIHIDGKNYNKYGTSFDIQMLVIDKNGATTQTETGYVETLQELQDKLGGIRDERPAIDYKGTEQKPSEQTRKETTRKRKDVDVGDGVVSGTDNITDNGKPADTPRTQRKPAVKDVQSTDTDGGKPANTKSENTDVVDAGQSLDGRGELGGRTELQDNRRTDISDSEQHSEQSNVDRSDGNVGTRQNNNRVQRPKRTELTDSIFEQYQTQPLRLNNTKPHPAKVSESAAMSAIAPPAVTYKPHLSQDIVEKGVVSDVQLEAISYAGQSHSQVLPNGTTRGFFLGDGTGIGKGRTIAGMMLDNYNQGRKKAVWVTLNPSLVNDAKRDVKALFGNSDLVMQFEGGEKANKILDKNEGILVVSYSTLSRGYDKKDSNFEKLVKWLGKDFDGLIVFDEAHKMGNATGKKGTRGAVKPSQTGLAGIALQEALPKSRVVYSSATGATEVENLRYAERLGLWGEGTAFITGDDFVSKIKAGGLASMELIARDMKAMGVYLSRNISYDDVQYDKITHELTSQQVKIYDELARSWQIVLKNINKALESTNQDKDGHARGRALGAFWSSQQRFFNQILTSMQVPSVISDIEKQLADGKSCVIQLVSTNESAQNQEFERLKSEDLELDEFDLTPKQVLMSMIENSFPVQQFEEYRDDNGNLKSQPVYDSMGNPVLNREAVRQRDELLEKLGSIKVPSSPIDMIINHFGTDLVAENTGRARRVIQKDGKTIEEKIGSKKDADVDAFQNGKKRIIIFSKAGGTGKSYHADKSAKNQQQRVHYLLEAGWQADNAVQGFGRSHRSNQASAPVFKLVTTNLKGQMRFISTIAKRLDQLGAMTKGQRQAGGQGMFTASDNLENSFASDVLAVFYKDLIANRVDGIDNGLAILEKLGIKDKILDEYNSIKPNAPELREVNKFLNRILSLESSEQNTVFEGYAQRLQEATEKAMVDGTLDKGLENYKADKITLNEVQDIREDEKSGAKTKYYNLTAEHKIKPVKFDSIPTESKSFLGFYQNKNTGVVRAVMRTSSVTDQYGNVTDNFKLMGQVKNEYIAQYRLYGNWTKIDTAKAETLWNEELTKLPEYRKENLHLISGVVLPVWDKLPTENVRIYRVLTSDGEMLIGRVVSEDMIDETLRRLGSVRKREKIATSDLIAGIKNGDTVHLENGWKIVQRKVSGENRIELVGVSYEHADVIKEKGVFTERIQYNTRYFIPADTKTEKIIDDILKLAPVIRIENSKYSSSDVSYDKASSDNRWKTDNVENQGKARKDVSLNSIVKKIRTKFGIPIATGKISNKDARGSYKRKAEVIRTRIANNLPTISHELGHHLDKLYSFSEMDSVEKLTKALPQDFINQYPTKEQGKEAVAEFVRTYLKSKTEAQKLSAEFYDDFVNSLSKTDLQVINDIAADFNYYLSMDIHDKYQSTIVNSKRTLKEKAKDVREGGVAGVKDAVSDKAHETYTKWIDSFDPIKQAVDFVEKSTGKTIDGKDNAYILATNSLNSATVASYLVNEGFKDFDDNILEDEMSFAECIKGVKAKDLNTLSEYLVLKHSLELLEQDMRVFADDTLEDVDTINETIERIEREHPEMIEASENLYQYQRNMLRYYLVDSGLLTEEGFNAMVEKYPCYVPFYRDVSKNHGHAKGTFANQSTPIKRIKGSGASILNPLESIVRNTEKFVKAATRNQVMQVLTEYAKETDGFGQFLEKVPPDMLPHVIDITKQKEKFTERLQQTVNAVDYFNVTNLLDEVLTDMVMDFTPKANASKKLVTVMENGRASYYQVHDEALYKAIAEMSMPQMEGILKTVTQIMLPMKMLMTQSNPLFTASNFFRDYATAYKHSQVNNPFAFAMQYYSALKAIVSNNEMYQQYKAMGGGHSSKLSTDIDQIQRMLRDVASKDMGKARRLAYSLFRHPIETIASINDVVESIPRVLEFIRTLEQTGDLQEAIFSADDITTNFKRHGSGATAKFTNSMVLFNNAALQGLDKTRRSLTGDNKGAKLTKWVLFALLSSALQYFWNKHNDEEGYKTFSSYAKNNFYNYSIGDGKFISIPKPREVALLDSFTERTIEYVFGNEEAFYDFGGYLADNLLPPMLPNPLNENDAVHDVLGNTVLGGVVDIGYNKDFLGRPIESNYESNYLFSWQRYDEGTSKLAHWLGQTEWAREDDISPQKIDHLLSSYLGIIGTAIQSVFPMEESRKDTTLGLRNRFVKDSVYSTDVMNKLWDNVDKAEKQYNFTPTIDNAMEYEQNAIVTKYMSEMLNCIYALPLDEQRDARKYLLKNLNSWDYELTESQQQMKTSLGDREIDSKIIIKLPSSTYEWTEDKIKYTYQMTPEEYNSFAKNYLIEVEKYRKWCKKTYTDSDKYVDKLSDYNGAVMKYMRPYYNKQFKSKATKK